MVRPTKPTRAKMPHSVQAGFAASKRRRIRPLVPLIFVGALLVGSALWLRSSKWTRNVGLQTKGVAELEAAVRSTPDDALARYYLAKQYYLNRRFADARDAYGEA